MSCILIQKISSLLLATLQSGKENLRDQPKQKIRKTKREQENKREQVNRRIRENRKEIN